MSILTLQQRKLEIDSFIENKINESINSTDSLSAQKRLNQFKEEELKKVEETFREVSTDLGNMFEKMKRTKDMKINNDLREFADRIQQQLKSTEIVVSNILFKGSGNDCIYRHGVNVAALSALLGKWIGLEAPKINLLIYTALLHDFGIIKLDNKLQEKPDLLLDNNFVCN